MSTEQTTGTDLVFAKSSLEERMHWAKAIAAAGDLVPSGFRNRDGSPNAAKILLAAETGAMLGVHPIAALNGIHVIEGKPTISPALMSGLVRKAGHKLRVTTKGDVSKGTFEATATLIRADDPDFTYSATWNADRARRAGLLGKGTWSKYFEAMCKARAISEVVREGAEDVLMGSYTPEEMGAVVTEEGELIREDLVEDANIIDAELVPDAPSRSVPDASRPGRAAQPSPAGSGPGEAIPGYNAPDPRDADRHAVADEWADRARRALTVTDARDLYRDAKHRGILDYPLSTGELLEDVLRARGEHLAAEETHTEPAPELDDYSSEPAF